MKLLVELPTWLGDCIMTTPAIENLANFYNDAQITLIGSSVSIEAMRFHPKVVETVKKSLKISRNYRGKWID